jgi:POT family proton-dependent oligopeptide transporter
MEDTDGAERPKSDDGFDDLDNMSSISEDEPTEEEIRTLRRIADQLPWSVW